MSEPVAPIKPTPLPVAVRQFKNNTWHAQDDVISHEIPILMQCPGQNAKKLWAWPDDLQELVLGHALLDMGWNGTAMSVETSDNRYFTLHSHGKETGNGSGDPGTLHGIQVMKAMQDFMGDEGLWDGTGCFHRAGIFDAHNFTLLKRAEDIGRHNCVDRLAGWAHQQGIAPANHVLLISARITASLCAKILRAGFRFLISRSAVTTAAVEMAHEHEATLVGFARDREHRFSVFADPKQRIPDAVE